MHPPPGFGSVEHLAACAHQPDAAVVHAFDDVFHDVVDEVERSDGRAGGVADEEVAEWEVGFEVEAFPEDLIIFYRNL